jgi:hypothetical protein
MSFRRVVRVPVKWHEEKSFAPYITTGYLSFSEDFSRLSASLVGGDLTQGDLCFDKITTAQVGPRYCHPHKTCASMSSDLTQGDLFFDKIATAQVAPRYCHPHNTCASMRVIKQNWCK